MGILTGTAKEKNNFIQYGAIICTLFIVIAINIIDYYEKSFSQNELLFWPETSEYGYIDEEAEYNGPFSYGNGISLNRGLYRVRIGYEEDTYNKYEVVFRVNNNEQIITEGYLPPDTNQHEILFNLPSNIRNESVEIRTYYGGTGRFKLTQVTFTKEMPIAQTLQFLTFYFIVMLGIIITLKDRKIAASAGALYSFYMIFLYKLFCVHTVRMIMLSAGMILVFCCIYKMCNISGRHILKFGAIFISSLFLMMLCSESSPIYSGNTWDDVNVFYAIGKKIIQGGVLYRDIFDHKGPWLYFIYALGYMISPNTFYGIYLIESFFMALLLYAVFLLSKIFFDEYISWVTMIVSAVFLLDDNFIGKGSNCEQLEMVFVGICLLSFFMYFTGCIWQKLRILLFADGACFTMLFFMKFTNSIGPFILIGIMIVHTFIYGKNKIKSLLYLLSGMLAAMLPVIIYFIRYHALYDLYTGYFKFNLAYADVRTIQESIATLLKHCIDAILYNRLNFVLILIGILAILFSNRILSDLWGKVGIVLAFGGTFVSAYLGHNYIYYYGIIGVFSILGIIAIVDYALRHSSLKVDNRKAIVCIGAISCLMLLYVNQNFKDAAIFSDNITFAEACYMEMENSGLQKNVLVYRQHCTQVFAGKDVMPAVKYFFQPGVSYDNFREIYEEQDRYIMDGIPEYIVCVNEGNNSVIAESGKYKKVLDWPHSEGRGQLYRIIEQR